MSASATKSAKKKPQLIPLGDRVVVEGMLARLVPPGTPVQVKEAEPVAAASQPAAPEAR